MGRGFNGHRQPGAPRIERADEPPCGALQARGRSTVLCGPAEEGKTTQLERWYEEALRLREKRGSSIFVIDFVKRDHWDTFDFLVDLRQQAVRELRRKDRTRALENDFREFDAMAVTYWRVAKNGRQEDLPVFESSGLKTLIARGFGWMVALGFSTVVEVSKGVLELAALLETIFSEEGGSAVKAQASRAARQLPVVLSALAGDKAAQTIRDYVQERIDEAAFLDAMTFALIVQLAKLDQLAGGKAQSHYFFIDAIERLHDEACFLPQSGFSKQIGTLLRALDRHRRNLIVAVRSDVWPALCGIFGRSASTNAMDIQTLPLIEVEHARAQLNRQNFPREVVERAIANSCSDDGRSIRLSLFSHAWHLAMRTA